MIAIMIGRCKAAKAATETSSEIRDWRLTRKTDREMKALAVELLKGKGYIIASAWELKKKYPTYAANLSDSDTGRYVWGIKRSVRRNGKYKLNFVAF